MRDSNQNNYVPEEYWDRRYEQLDLTRSGHRDLPEAYNVWLYRRKQDVLSRALREMNFPTRGKRVLEIGVGTGVYLNFWNQSGCREIVGIDISQIAVDHLKEKHPDGTFLHRDISVPGLKDEVESQFDLVTALDVFYHIIDGKKLACALRNVTEVLAPNGLLAIHDQFLHRQPDNNATYIRWRSLTEWNCALSEAGLESVGRFPIFFLLVPGVDHASGTSSRRWATVWNHAYPRLARFPNLFGHVFYRFDTLLGSLLSEGPSMELMLVRRKA